MKQYIKENKERFYDELFSLLRIPSISAKPEHKGDMQKCAERLVELLLQAGADQAAVYPSAGNPVVFGQKILDPSYKTVLVYGHYDVQPPEPLEKWRTDPFEPVIAKDPNTGEEAIYCRGANDDKGQLFMHLKAFEFMLRSGKLHHNVKFVFEGEEEIGSGSLPAWVREHKDLLAADVILVSDTTMISDKVPSINCGMRGLAYLEVTVTGPNKDLHSGHYGGAVANPINTLCDMISSLIDKDGRVTIPGFYDDVVELSAADRAQLARAPFDLEEYKEFLDIKEVKGEKGYTTMERTGIRPCLDVCGIWGGYTGVGAKTVLPSVAHAKISMRLVPNQLSAKITELFKKHFLAIAPPYVKVDVKPCEGGNGFLIPISSPAFQAASKAMAEVYGIEPVPSRGGGSIAVLAEMQQILGIDPLLMGFGLERDTIHSPNESYLLRQFFAGMESIALFYQYY
ncbi:MAG: dipeptidase [Bacteroidales bacterium]|nr:dipeptidase [Bacteroidales bacterium]MBQ7467897.1 dipeptidase [Bacteroidales bacterium]MBQ8461066.1 dipeptidase [Bacteroidales bacterium]MCR5363138.1 dipeptidase [Bacteroidales bacterium]MDT3360432.1 dipeptidase [Bacteroidota bacterium]